MFKYKSSQKEKGFTLIELLVVIALIGVLAAVILVALGSSRDKGQDARKQSQLKSLLSQAQLYNGATGTAVAATVGTTVTGAAGGNLFTSTTSTDNSLYNIMSKFPTNTVLYYAWDGNPILTGGKWFVAVSGSKGAYCIDYTTALKTAVGTPPPLTAVAGDFTALFPNAITTGTTPYSCN